MCIVHYIVESLVARSPRALGPRVHHQSTAKVSSWTNASWLLLRVLAFLPREQLSRSHMDHSHGRWGCSFIATFLVWTSQVISLQTYHLHIPIMFTYIHTV